MCSGSLIRSNMILSAAHCFDEIPCAYIDNPNRHNHCFVLSGVLEDPARYNLTNGQGAPQTGTVNLFEVHPKYQTTVPIPGSDYNSIFIAYDLAIARIDREFLMDPYTQVIALATQPFQPRWLGLVCGSGALEQNGRQNGRILHCRHVEMMDQNECLFLGDVRGRRRYWGLGETTCKFDKKFVKLPK